MSARYSEGRYSSAIPRVSVGLGVGSGSRLGLNLVYLTVLYGIFGRSGRRSGPESPRLSYVRFENAGVRKIVGLPTQ